MTVHQTFRRRLAPILLAGALAAGALAPAAASARIWDSAFLPVYTLTPTQRNLVCHEFTGTMTYDDGYRVDCKTGNVYYTPPAQS